MAAIVHQQLIGKQVGLMLEDGVSRFEETSRGVTVHLKSGKQIPADMVLLSIGVRPETDWAKEAGLTIGALGGIAVNEYMQTSNPDIYVGRCRGSTPPRDRQTSLDPIGGSSE